MNLQMAAASARGCKGTSSPTGRAGRREPSHTFHPVGSVWLQIWHSPLPRASCPVQQEADPVAVTNLRPPTHCCSGGWSHRCLQRVSWELRFG